MSNILLHIGTHKTATTSVQRYLSRHRAELARRGVFYPGYDLIGKRNHYAHFGIVNAFSGQHPLFDRQDAIAFFREVRARSADYDTTILSAESFYRHGTAAGTPDEAAYWRARNDYLKQLQDVIGPAGVVVVFREQADYADSLFQERVKVTRYAGSFEAFLQEAWYHFCYSRQCAAWQTHFGNVRALNFHRLAATGDAALGFLTALNLPIEGLAPPKRFNSHMPADLVALKRMLNATSDDSAALTERLERLGKVLTRRAILSNDAHSFFASQGARRAFQQRFAADNEALRAFMEAGPAPTEPVFPLDAKVAKQWGDAPSSAFMSSLVQLALEKRKPKASPFRRALSRLTGLLPGQR